MLRTASRKLFLAITLAALAAPGARLFADPAPITGTNPEPEITGTNPEPEITGTDPEPESILEKLLVILHLA
jgi:hypothetical protein